MTTERFHKLVEEIRKASLDTLAQKNANYATAEDRLHNFKVGAAITGGTPAQAALGYMAKHLASLQDKVARNDFHDRADLKEKIQDSINYLVFIWCCANEEMENTPLMPDSLSPIMLGIHRQASMQNWMEKQLKRMGEESNHET